MKSLFKFIITKILSIKASWYLKRKKVQVIAITGSVGKTTTKQAIYHLLKDRFNVYASSKGFNTELGMSLAILQQESSGFSSVAAWSKILFDVFFKRKPFYKKIILEMGADGKGDIKKLVSIAHPSIAVVTAVNEVHMADGQFSSIEEISHEKNELIRYLKKSEIAILNADNPWVAKMKTEAKVLKYGTDSEFGIYASKIKVLPTGLRFTVHFQDESANFEVPVLGDFQIYPLLAALSVAVSLKMKLDECSKILKNFKLPVGRMNPIEGLSSAMILDGSYNASPVSMKGAIQLLFDLKSKRKIAALGTMNELGDLSKEAHLKIGGMVPQVDLLIAVGPEAASLKQGAVEAGMDPTNVYTFLDSEEAGYFLKEKLQEGDLILVKGSQNHVRMERLIKVIMKNPEKAKDLLCRQGDKWQII